MKTIKLKTARRWIKRNRDKTTLCIGKDGGTAMLNAYEHCKKVCSSAPKKELLRGTNIIPEMIDY